MRERERRWTLRDGALPHPLSGIPCLATRLPAKNGDRASRNGYQAAHSRSSQCASQGSRSTAQGYKAMRKRSCLDAQLHTHNMQLLTHTSTANTALTTTHVLHAADAIAARRQTPAAGRSALQKHGKHRRPAAVPGMMERKAAHLHRGRCLQDY